MLSKFPRLDSCQEPIEQIKPSLTTLRPLNVHPRNNREYIQHTATKTLQFTPA